MQPSTTQKRPFFVFFLFSFNFFEEDVSDFLFILDVFFSWSKLKGSTTFLFSDGIWVPLSCKKSNSVASESVAIAASVIEGTLVTTASTSDTPNHNEKL